MDPVNGSATADESKLGAGGSPTHGDFSESAQLAVMTCGLSTQRRSGAATGPDRSGRTTRAPVAVAPELSCPRKKFLLIESEVFADLNVRD